MHGAAASLSGFVAVSESNARTVPMAALGLGSAVLDAIHVAQCCSALRPMAGSAAGAAWISFMRAKTSGRCPGCGGSKQSSKADSPATIEGLEACTGGRLLGFTGGSQLDKRGRTGCFAMALVRFYGDAVGEPETSSLADRGALRWKAVGEELVELRHWVDALYLLLYKGGESG
jgi:hypothetical protein